MMGRLMVAGKDHRLSLSRLKKNSDASLICSVAWPRSELSQCLNVLEDDARTDGALGAKIASMQQVAEDISLPPEKLNRERLNSQRDPRQTDVSATCCIDAIFAPRAHQSARHLPTHSTLRELRSRPRDRADQGSVRILLETAQRQSMGLCRQP